VRAPRALDARIEGGLTDLGWRGRLAALSMADVGLLKSAPELSWDGKALLLGNGCVEGPIGRACIEAAGDAAAGRLSAQLDGLRLREVMRLRAADEGAQVDGQLSGRADLAWRDGRPATGEAVLRSEGGRLRLPGRDDVDFGWDDLALEATLEGGRGTVRGTVRLRPEGELTLDGGFALDQPEGFSYDVDVDVAIRNLEAIEAFTTIIADPEGDLSGQFKMRGGASWPPDISGAVALTGFTALVPDQAIRVRDGVLVVAGVPDRLVVRGSLRSGDGVLSIDGRIDPADPVPAEMRLVGENFRIANSPTMMLVASPDLRLAMTQRRWNLDGNLVIPRARIDLERLEGGVAASPDVVVIDDQAPPDPARPWRARVLVELGDDVQLKGFGFDGRLAGRLDVRQRQGARATATGQLDVTGTYRAYGQRLTIREGHLRYAASPLDEPTIDLRAERNVRGETVALTVTGNALSPTARVIGAPGMSEQDALALLVTGRPLRATGSGDRDALAGAVSALGLVGGDLLAGQLRGGLGLDEFGVSSDTALDGEAFTIGKYLTPRLFVGYGIGLLTRGEVFTVRFLVTDRFDVEASSGETRRAEVNYRIER
jgi:translocation and assembly module TamB